MLKSKPLALGAVLALSVAACAGAGRAAEVDRADRQIVFRVEGLTCPAVGGLG